MKTGWWSRVLTTTAVLAAGFGCAPATMPPPAPAAVTTPAAAPAASAPEPTRSQLSYGIVTARVERGKTTQLELLELLGGPNISTVDAEGNETWVYERSVTETDIATNSNYMKGAMGLDLAFGIGSFGGGVSASGGAGRASSASRTTSTVRTLTVIVKFNKDKTVKDYTARASYF